jgi:WhiB family redox-sensing transcriptional regulator
LSTREWQSGTVTHKRLAELNDDWKLKAACRGMELKPFFGHGDSARSREMMDFCYLACSVRENCLIWALYVPEEWGIWGGHNSDQRREMRRDPRVQKVLKEKKFLELVDTAV